MNRSLAVSPSDAIEECLIERRVYVQRGGRDPRGADVR